SFGTRLPLPSACDYDTVSNRGRESLNRIPLAIPFSQVREGECVTVQTMEMRCILGFTFSLEYLSQPYYKIKA
ncbi:MAG: hypothetical protein WCO26_13295, partial [Deltaproteobacteria bacterium]